MPKVVASEMSWCPIFVQIGGHGAYLESLSDFRWRHAFLCQDDRCQKRMASVGLILRSGAYIFA